MPNGIISEHGALIENLFGNRNKIKHESIFSLYREKKNLCLERLR